MSIILSTSHLLIQLHSGCCMTTPRTKAWLLFKHAVGCFISIPLQNHSCIAHVIQIQLMGFVHLGITRRQIFNEGYNVAFCIFPRQEQIFVLLVLVRKRYALERYAWKERYTCKPYVSVTRSWEPDNTYGVWIGIIRHPSKTGTLFTSIPFRKNDD